MKTNKLLIIPLLLFAIFLASCNDDFDNPPMYIPESTWVANTTILELKTAYQGTLDTVGKRSDGKDYIIKGTVIGNDIGNNIYKNLVIQDSTAAITIAIDATRLYQTYRLGQQIVLNCTGLNIGRFNGLWQLGGVKEGSTSISFMSLETFQNSIQLNGLPVTPVDTLTMTIAEVNAATSTTDLIKYQSQLVLFKGVSFEGGGTESYVENSSRTTRYIKSGSNTLQLNNSAYCDFGSQLMPSGTGNVMGILSYYNSYQLLLIDIDNVYDFTSSSDTITSPTDTVPSTSDDDANITILALKQKFYSSTPATIGKNDSGDDYIIKGTIVGNDVDGNIFKNIIVQDATAAITIAINNTSLYTYYPIGKEFIINCTGFDIGLFNGLQQFGLNNNGTMTFMTLSTFQANTKESSGTGTIDTISMTMSQLSTTEDFVTKYQSQLVKFSDVSFTGGGSLTYANGTSNTNRYILNSANDSVIVRVRGSSTFAGTTLPAGTGNLVGILSYFNDYQVLMRMASDAYGFTTKSSYSNIQVPFRE